MKYILNRCNIDKAIETFSENEHFKHIALSRLLVVYAIKKQLKNITDIKWYFEYNFANVNDNRILLSYQPAEQTGLELFFEIPLNQKFELRAFLGISSAHFLDIYNFLIENEIIQENQFVLKAAYHTIPHFILNTTKQYNVEVLRDIEHLYNTNSCLKLDENIQKDITEGYSIFLPIFKTILRNFTIK